MKKLIAVMLMLCLLCPWACAEQIANPWRETTAEEMVETIGLSFFVPEEAQNVIFRMMESEAVAEMQFTLEDAECIARIKPAVQFEDISGMYYEWTSVEECEILWCPGTAMQTVADDRAVSLCLWYDVVPGLMYSVSAASPAELPVNIIALANRLFDPAQGDVDQTPADVLTQALIGCTGYEGTAGCSLKEAIAAVGLLDFAVHYAEEESMEEIVESAMAVLSDEQKQELTFSLEGISVLMESAFVDYAAVAGLFDDAGVGETMQSLIDMPEAQTQWNALHVLLKPEA